MKQDTIKLPYPGDCISVNHYLGRRKGGGYYVLPETKVWKEEIQWLLKRCHLEDYHLPLHVTCSGYFKNERAAPDLSNLSKVILDSIQDLIGGNDKDYRWHDGTRTIGELHPYMLITIRESSEEVPQNAPQRDSKPLIDKSKGNVPPVIKRGRGRPKKNQ